jgi:hypothetical protein
MSQTAASTVDVQRRKDWANGDVFCVFGVRELGPIVVVLLLSYFQLCVVNGDRH